VEGFEKAAEHAQPAHVHPGATAGEQATVWEPENGIERTAYTLLADLLTGIGFALLLAAGLALQGGDSPFREYKLQR
jgi:predicted cobalt transporter CbtA